MKKTKSQEIQKLMKSLDLTFEEATELYEFDNDNSIENETVKSIENKISQNTEEKQKRTSIEKVKNLKSKKKSDFNKEQIISFFFNSAETSNLIKNPQEMSANKLSFTDKDGNFYTISITKHKSRPAGYQY